MSLFEEASARLPGLAWTAGGPVDLPPLSPPAVPLGPLRRALKTAIRPVILINDLTRIVPRDLPQVLAEVWEEANQPPIVVATGSHKGDLARHRDRFGGLPLRLHDADDARAHIALDPTCRIDREVARADLILTFGTVEPHYFAGWSGAHKTATVGVIDRASITRNHALALGGAVAPCRLEGNPVFDDLARLATLLTEDRRLLAVNHVLDDDGRVLGLGLGTWRGSLERAIRSARRRFVHTCPEPVDLVVARVRGPLGRSLYQADKGIKNHERAVRDGGHLLLVADLPEGVGQDRFVELLRAAPDLASARARVEAEYVLGDHKAVRWRALEARGVQIRVVSAGSLDGLDGTGIEVCRSLADALAGTGLTTGAGLWVEDAGLVVSEVLR